MADCPEESQSLILHILSNILINGSEVNRTTMKQLDLSALRAKILAARESSQVAKTSTIESALSEAAPAEPLVDSSPTQNNIPNDDSAENKTTALRTGYDRNGHPISYNRKQSEFIDLAATGKSCVLIGAAGTGKTTTQRAAILELLANGMLPPIGAHDHSHLPPSTAPGIVICAFTRRATNNIRRNLTEDLQPNCLTIHKLLEYQPVDYETVDPETGKTIRSKRFEATRNAENPIPATIRTIVIEEASMVSTQLYQEIINACPHKPQFIFLGDIQQLPPVFGAAILGFALSALPVIELTEVYRQALESPILSLAHRILSGNSIKPSALEEWNQPKKGLIIHPWKKQISPENATSTLAKFFIAALNKGEYDPESDAILIPFNKSCGTIELNAHIANQIAKNEGREVYQILHGFLASYYSIGDKCLYDKEDAIILDIQPNAGYSGRSPIPHSTNLNYWGHIRSSADSDHLISEASENAAEDIDALLGQVASAEYENEDERTRAASHRIQLQLLDSDRTIWISSAGDMKKLDLGYAITVHKSQGSEWGRVFLCFHKSHATMLQRELLYTAVTRAKNSLLIICEKDTFQKGIESQRIRGNTLKDKAEYFKGKYSESDHPTFY